jgi:Mrp family chromosome partitioning ATPase
VALGFSQSETGDIITLTATSPDSALAQSAAASFTEAFTRARRQLVSSRSTGGQTSARTNLNILNDRLDVVEGELDDAGVTPPPVVEGSEDDPTPVLDLPPGTPTDTVLLAYERNTLINRIRDLQVQYADLGSQALTPQSYAEVVERPAPVQIVPPTPSPIGPAAIILGVGLLLALVTPVVIDRLDRTIEGASAAAGALGAPVLAAVPGMSRSERRRLAPAGTGQETAYRSLAATSLATDRLPGAILVTAPTGDVQDVVAANFAVGLAQLGVRVALMATSPRQTWYAEATGATEPRAGSSFGELLQRAHSGTLRHDVAPELSPTSVDCLWLIPALETDDDVLFDGLPPLIKALSQSSIDVTVIAGPSLLDEPDATIIAWATRSVLWAVEAGTVDEPASREAAARLELAGVTPFGIAFVGGES